MPQDWSIQGVIMMPNHQQQPQYVYIGQGNGPQQGNFPPVHQQQFAVGARPFTPPPGPSGSTPVRPTFTHSTPIGFQVPQSAPLPRFWMPQATNNNSLDTPMRQVAISAATESTYVNVYRLVCFPLTLTDSHCCHVASVLIGTSPVNTSANGVEPGGCGVASLHSQWGYVDRESYHGSTGVLIYSTAYSVAQ